jgi:4-amino-4-deoxy-L-arabinose transferase-like glycosyltransferase
MIRERRVWGPVLLLVVIGFALYLPRLGTSGLWDPWEPKYAQTAREMAAGGEWVIPHFREDERLNKVPMTYWMIAASHAVFGVNEFAARLPSALLAVLGAAALGGAFAARRRPLEGLLAGAALLTGPQWLLTGRFATPDMPLASLSCGALALVLLLESHGSLHQRRVAAVLLVLLVAAAGMTDWPRGLLLPLWGVLGWGALRWKWIGPIALVVVGGLYHAAQLTHNVPLNFAAIGLLILAAAAVLGLRVRVRWSVLFAGAAVIVILVTPWIVAAQILEPDEMSLFRYKYAFNLGETEGRFTAPYHYVLLIVAVGGLPWSALALVGLIRAMRSRADGAAGILAGAWLGGTLFFTLSEAGMGHFYGVLQPAVAGLAAIGGVALMRKLDWSAVPAVAALALVWFVASRHPTRILETATVKSSLFGQQLSWMVTAMMLAWLLALVAAKIRGREVWVVAAILPAALLAGKLGMQLVPALEPQKTTKHLWELYVERRVGDEPLGSVGRIKDSIFYYSDLAAIHIRSPEMMREYMSRPGTKFLISSNNRTTELRRLYGGPWEYLDQGEHPSHRVIRLGPRHDGAAGPE